MEVLIWVSATSFEILHESYKSAIGRKTLQTENMVPMAKYDAVAITSRRVARRTVCRVNTTDQGGDIIFQQRSQGRPLAPQVESRLRVQPGYVVR